MNELIKITEKNGKRAVSARELHVFLESKQQFADWIKGRISQYEFIENEDYVLISQNYETQKGRGGDRRSVEYVLTPIHNPT